jgi:hypothetical protein
VNEDRILNKLDAIEERGIDTLLAVTRLQEQMEDVPDLKIRVSALEKWKWTAMGALGTATASLGAQVYNAMKGA